jgi:hypothetical protein
MRPDVSYQPDALVWRERTIPTGLGWLLDKLHTGRAYRAVATFDLGVMGGRLPDQMFSSYSILEDMDTGETWTVTVQQGRSKHARRHNMHSSSDPAVTQAGLMTWAKRILRERAKEAAA